MHTYIYINYLDGGGQILGSIKNELLGKGVTSTTTTTTDAIIHIGDFGYDLQSNNGLNGDLFLINRIPKIGRINSNGSKNETAKFSIIDQLNYLIDNQI